MMLEQEEYDPFVIWLLHNTLFEPQSRAFKQAIYNFYEQQNIQQLDCGVKKFLREYVKSFLLVSRNILEVSKVTS